MLTFETYDDDNGLRLSKECLEDIAAVMEQYGYIACEVEEDNIIFVAE